MPVLCPCRVSTSHMPFRAQIPWTWVEELLRLPVGLQPTPAAMVLSRAPLSLSCTVLSPEGIIHIKHPNSGAVSPHSVSILASHWAGQRLQALPPPTASQSPGALQLPPCRARTAVPLATQAVPSSTGMWAPGPRLYCPGCRLPVPCHPALPRLTGGQSPMINSSHHF